MNNAKTFKYTTNLARKMASPGGRSVSEAIARAEGGLESHREAAMASLERILAGLEAACAARGTVIDAGLYDQAAALLDMAGFFDTGPLYRAAFSLCDVSDRMIERGVWDWPSIEVHVRALRLILGDGCRESEDARVLLEGLAAVSKRLG